MKIWFFQEKYAETHIFSHSFRRAWTSTVFMPCSLPSPRITYYLWAPFCCWMNKVLPRLSLAPASKKTGGFPGLSWPTWHRAAGPALLCSLTPPFSLTWPSKMRSELLFSHLPSQESSSPRSSGRVLLTRSSLQEAPWHLEACFRTPIFTITPVGSHSNDKIMAIPQSFLTDFKALKTAPFTL